MVYVPGLGWAVGEKSQNITFKLNLFSDSLQTSHYNERYVVLYHLKYFVRYYISLMYTRKGSSFIYNKIFSRP